MEASMNFEKPFTLRDQDVALETANRCGKFLWNSVSLDRWQLQFSGPRARLPIVPWCRLQLDGHCLAFLATYRCSDSRRYGRRNVGAAAAGGAGRAGAGEREQRPTASEGRRPACARRLSLVL